MDKFPSRTLAAAITLALAGVAGAVSPSFAAPSPIDPPLVQIHQIQKPWFQSDYEGQPVTIEGIVTTVRQDGFFLQAPDNEADNDEWTSEGIFVFTGSNVPTTAQVGYRLRVSGKVAEQLTDPMSTQSYRTQIEPVWSVERLTEAPVALPTPFRLELRPNTPINNRHMESYEGMRVIMPGMSVSGPTEGSVDGSTGAIVSNGLFYGEIYITGILTREPGISRANRLPIPYDPEMQIPRWDQPSINLAVDSTSLGHSPIDVSVDTKIENLAGILDERQGYYTLLVEPGSQESVAPEVQPWRVSYAPPEDNLRLAHLPLDRFFDAVDSPDIAEPVLSPATFEQRLAKASLALRDYLSGEYSRSPPYVIGVTGVENLSTLQALADRVNADFYSPWQNNPVRYSAHLISGNDPNGLNIGYLIRIDKSDSNFFSTVPKVIPRSITQIGKDAMLTLPDGTSIPLYEHPPLLLEAMAYTSPTKATPITTILVDLLPEDGGNTDTAAGERVRLQRQRQAEYLAAYVQARQQSNPSIRLAVLGQFNALQVNDGLADVMGTIMGTPSPDNTTVIPGDGRDLVVADLSNTDPDFPRPRYYLNTARVRGYSQKLNHILMSEGLALASNYVNAEMAGITSMFPASAVNEANSPSGLSRHDPLVTDFRLRSEALMDYAEVGFEPLPSSSTSHSAGQTLRIPVTALNYGYIPSPLMAVGFAFDARLSNLTVIPSNPDWTCYAPVITAQDTSVGCYSRSGDPGHVDFTIEAETTPDMASRTIHFVGSQHLGPVHDPDPSNNEVGMSIQLY